MDGICISILVENLSIFSILQWRPGTAEGMRKALQVYVIFPDGDQSYRERRRLFSTPVAGVGCLLYSF